MAWYEGTQGLSGAPATDLYDTIVNRLTNWTFIKTVAAATAGTTADCKVWRAPDSDWYLIFEPDNANNRIRARVSHQFNSATDKVSRYVPAVGASTSSTPRADYSYDDTEQTIATAGYAEVDVNGTGFNWWLGVGQGNGSPQDLIYLGTSAGLGKSLMAGLFTPVASADTRTMFLWAGGQAASTSTTWANSGSGGTMRTAFEWGVSGSTQGAFCFTAGFLPVASGGAGAIYSTSRNLYVSPGIYAFNVLIHGVSGTSSLGVSGRFYRGTIHSALKCCASGNITIGDTVTIGGTTYLVAGVAGTSTHFSSTLALLIDTSSF